MYFEFKTMNGVIIMEAFILSAINDYSRFDTEIECRLGTMTNNGFIPGVSYNSFIKIKHVLDNSTKWNETHSRITKDVIVGRYRNTYDTDDNVSCICKQKIRHFDSVDMRACVNFESPCDIVKETPDAVLRSKERSSYIYGIWRYDLTSAMTNGRQSYEVELELFDIPKVKSYAPSFVAKSFLHKMAQLSNLAAMDASSPVL
jgi:hypothetical protein